VREAVRILLALALGVLIGLSLDYRPRTGQPAYQESRAGYVQLNARGQHHGINLD
jgi:hypothetical protein